MPRAPLRGALASDALAEGAGCSGALWDGGARAAYRKLHNGQVSADGES
ncbi:MAG TPA: hypothetical protein PLX71_02490 [Phycicoccus sp.]|nr:hypothetical protein [Phycicoccus sp.]